MSAANAAKGPPESGGERASSPDGRVQTTGRAAFPQVVILAGGLGTRLRSALGDALPKALAPCAGRPFISFVLEAVAAAGARDVLLLVGRGAAEVREALGGARVLTAVSGRPLVGPGGSPARLAVQFSEEDEPLGTGGAIVRAHELGLLAERFVLTNGDTLLEADLAALVDAHADAFANHGAVATFAAVSVADASRYGSLRLEPWGASPQPWGASSESTQHLVGFAEKGDSGTGLVSTGIAVIENELFVDAPQHVALSYETDLAPGWLERGMPLAAWLTDGIFTDIGTPETYAAFCESVGGDSQ